MKKHDEIESDFFSLIDVEDEYLPLVVKCHYAIDKMLDRALTETLPQASAIELKRISFLLKVDFLTALGGLRPHTRKLFELANTVRNKFAHDPYAEFAVGDAAKAKSLLCSHVPVLVPERFKEEEDFQDILKTLFSVCFLQASVAYGNTCRQKVSNIVAQQLVQETISPLKIRTRSIPIHDDFENRCKLIMTELYPGVEPA
jgi:hypothetical protein